MSVKQTAGRTVLGDIAPEVKHWHGAKKDSWFTHIALSIPTPNATTEWCEEVTEEEYQRLGE